IRTRRASTTSAGWVSPVGGERPPAIASASWMATPRQMPIVKAATCLNMSTALLRDTDPSCTKQATVLHKSITCRCADVAVDLATVRKRANRTYAARKRGIQHPRYHG